MRIIFLVFFNLLLFQQAWAQIYPGNIYLRSQAAVDSFAYNYPPMTHMTGLFFIGDTVSTDIHDLSALPRMRYISQLFIGNTQLTTLESYAGVDTTFQCWVQLNPQLKTLRGLERLKKVGDYLIVRFNDVLPDLVGLDSVQSTGEFFIMGNNNLQTLQGANRLLRAQKLTIKQNNRLKTISGFPSLKIISFFTVTANDSLEHFGGFPQLDSIVDFDIYNNPRLKDFAGFNNGQALRCGLYSVSGNPALESLVGMEHLLRVSGATKILDNPLLKQVLHFDDLQEAYFYIRGAAIDTLSFPALIKGGLEVSNCPALVHLHNVFPMADSILWWKVHDNPALLSVHEDAGPKKIRELGIYANPLFQSLTGFDSTLRCAVRTSPGPFGIYKVYVYDADLVELAGFRNLRIGGFDLSKTTFTHNMERIEGFDKLETALGGLQFTPSPSGSPSAKGPRVLKGFSNLKKVIDGPLSFQVGVQDTMLGFQLLDSLIGESAACSVGWRSACYVNPDAFSKLAYSEGSIRNGHATGTPWPLPALKKIFRNALTLTGYPHASGFKDIFPQLEEVGMVTAVQSDIRSLDGLEGIRTFDDNWYGDHTHIILQDCPNLDDCAAVCDWFSNATFIPSFGPIIISNPLFPCTNQATIQAWCDTVTAVTAPFPTGNQVTESGLLVYPNPVPVGSVLYFRVPEAAIGLETRFQCYDMQGRARAIRVLGTGADYALSTADWPAGYFVLQVQTTERVWAATVHVIR